MYTKIANVSATGGFYRHVGMLRNYKVLQANLFTAFHEREGVITISIFLQFRA